MFDVVKKLSMVVTPSITRAGTAFHSIQNVTKDEVTNIRPRYLIMIKNIRRRNKALTWYKDSCVIKPFISGKMKAHFKATVIS